MATEIANQLPTSTPRRLIARGGQLVFVLSFLVTVVEIVVWLPAGQSRWLFASAVGMVAALNVLAWLPLSKLVATRSTVAGKVATIVGFTLTLAVASVAGVALIGLLQMAFGLGFG